MSDFNVLIVDDVGKNIQVVANLLKDEHYHLSYAMSGEQALEILLDNIYDLILLDIMMPGMNGFETCKKIKHLPNYSETPVIFLTARDDHDSIVQGFESGGQDYVTKPFNTSELIARVRTHLKLRAFENAQQQKIDRAVKELKALNEELENSQKEVVFTMGAIAETRSKETGMHVKRVAEYSKLLALLSDVPIHEADIVALASPMHDLGKVGIPDNILNKPGPLTKQERKIMDTHAQLGYDMLKHSKRQIMQTAAIIALEHHEKWDGSGYPQGLKGEEIPMVGRICGLTDVFDALMSARPYKHAWRIDDTVEEIKKGRNTHFDPKVLDAFLNVLPEIKKIYKRYIDPYKNDV